MSYQKKLKYKKMSYVDFFVDLQPFGCNYKRIIFDPPSPQFGVRMTKGVGIGPFDNQVYDLSHTVVRYLDGSKPVSARPSARISLLGSRGTNINAFPSRSSRVPEFPSSSSSSSSYIYSSFYRNWHTLTCYR